MIKRLKEAQDVQERELRIIENQMREEKKYFTNSFVILKNRLIKNEKNDEHKLIELTEQSNNIINVRIIIKLSNVIILIFSI